MNLDKECVIKDAAKIIGVTERQVRRYCKQGLLGKKPGRDWLFSKEELDAFVRPPRGRPWPRGQ